MVKVDAYEQQILKAYDSGRLSSIATKSELAKFRATARATTIKDQTLSLHKRIVG